MPAPDLPSRFRAGYSAFAGAASHLASPLLLVLRLYFGWQFAQAGWGKLTNLGRTAEFFASLGLPFPAANAFLAGSVECFGGLLLLVGLASRLAAIPLTFTMIVAYVTAERDALNAIFSETDKFLAAAPFLFLLASLVVLAFGPGRFSVDRWLRWETAGNAPGGT